MQRMDRGIEEPFKGRAEKKWTEFLNILSLKFPQVPVCTKLTAPVKLPGSCFCPVQKKFSSKFEAKGGK